MKIKMIDLSMQIESRKLIFIIHFSELDFFKFATRMPQIAQILVSKFQKCSRGACLWIPLNISSFFGFSNSKLCFNLKKKKQVASCEFFL